MSGNGMRIIVVYTFICVPLRHVGATSHLESNSMISYKTQNNKVNNKYH